MKKLNRKGFTLAELLIVVAIIAVLVAVSIPVFTAQLEKSREETDIANLRSAYAIASADALTRNYKNDDASAGTFVATPPYASGGTDVYYAFYSIKDGKLSSSETNAAGKGTTGEGKCEEQNGPLFYNTKTKANAENLVVMIVEKDGVADQVFAGFTTDTGSDVTGSSVYDMTGGD